MLLKSLALTSCFALAFAQEQAEKKVAVDPVMIQCHFYCIEISREDMGRLLFHATPSLLDSQSLHMQLREMVQKDQAKVIESSLILVRGGERATAESIMQTHFPVDCAPGGTMQFYQSNKPLNPQWMRLVELYRIPPMASSFTNRDLGSVLDVQPKWDQTTGKIVLDYNWEITNYLGQKQWIESKDHAGDQTEVSTPLILSKRLDATVTCEPSKPIWLGMFQPHLPDGKNNSSKKWLVFVKCEMQKLP